MFPVIFYRFLLLLTGFSVVWSIEEPTNELCSLLCPGEINYYLTIYFRLSPNRFLSVVNNDGDC